MKRMLLLGLLVVYSFPASAATLQYDFSYALTNGESISGSFLGELQGDNDTINLSEMPQYRLFWR